MTIYLIRLEVVDGEHVHYDDQYVIAKNAETAIDYANEYLSTFFGEGETTVKEHDWGMQSWDNAQEQCASVGTVVPFGTDWILNVDTGKMVKVEMVPSEETIHNK